LVSRVAATYIAHHILSPLRGSRDVGVHLPWACALSLAEFSLLAFEAGTGD
jgi:hypothetical protein